MPKQPAPPQDSSPIPFRSHTALLLATALPFLQLPYRHTVELLLKFLEFSETIKLYREFHMSQDSPFFTGSQPPKEPGLFGLINTFILDLEGLLSSLSKVCTGDEKEVVGMFLNVIRAKTFYDTYGDVLKGFMSSATDGEGDTSPLQSMFGSLFSGADFGDIFGAVTPEAKEPPPVPVDKPEEAAAPGSVSPFSGDLTSFLNDEQKETLNLLKNLFESE